MLRSPRERFTSSTYKDAWSKVIASESFEEATCASLLELQAEQPPDPSPNQAADSMNRLIGARRFLEILCTIHHVPTKPTKHRTESLNFEAGV